MSIFLAVLLASVVAASLSSMIVIMWLHVTRLNLETWQVIILRVQDLNYKIRRAENDLHRHSEAERVKLVNSIAAWRLERENAINSIRL